ncbi:quinohemoprotein amine dehydrogenase subunit alpha [Arcobacter defluvii]|uniref:Quinohemoprotein amine dehydrogenase, alpha subunit n=1 Tax=Arcobacter defluvii TaxID=873191 RepID=A0AAE7E7B4_9BACT|nr:quinohemoprotein amine dehydrogenase subunit alpha [Arcobacter defluvii]QKF77389.1 quinohemoprotein amine dehydrogenase, alpha subunit [Arcobacter defluvii]
MKTTYLNSIWKISMGFLMSAAALYGNEFQEGKNIIETKCVSCHTGNINVGLSRIEGQRKTPEGWYMTIYRMKNHGLSITDREIKFAVKYLSDIQGLNYQETIPYRYILEQTPNYQEKYSTPLLTETCARCHSEARIGIQRRNFTEWTKLVDFHIGQFPTLEFQALSRDRDWVNIAKNEVVPYLSENFGNDKKFELKAIDFEGSWTLFGHKLGDGDFSATLKLTKTSKDNYSLTLDGNFVDGRELKATGNAIVYSGYEFRAKLDVNGISYNQIFAVNPQTLQLAGSMFETLHHEEYSFVKGAKNSDKETSILGVSPISVKAGNSKTITIIGNNLDKNIKLSNGLKINKVVEKSSNKVVLDVTASSKYDVKQIDLIFDSKTFEKELVVYKKIDALKIVPDYAISRVGDGGGAMPKQYANFEAIGLLAGTDGKIGTSDDISIGKVNAKWNIEAFDERAIEDEDVKYVGKIDAFSGKFTPSFAGPNPLRKFSTNNAGNIKVVATYKDGVETYKADSHMMVTVQKWVNPPIN